MYVHKGVGLFELPTDYKQTFDHPFSLNVGKHEIIKMRNNQVITDRDVKIARFLFQFVFATGEQLHALFGESVLFEHFQKRLDKLVAYRVLNKFMLSEFEMEDVKPDALQVYCLDVGGRDLLSHYSHEDVTDWYTTVNMKTSELVSKHLIVTDFFIRLLQTCSKKVAFFRAEPDLRIGKKQLIPSFEMSLLVQGMRRYFLGEVVRDFDFPFFFRDRLSKYEALLTTNGWKKYYYDGQQPPVWFLIVETDYLALEASRMIYETTNIRQFRVTTAERMRRPLHETGAFLRYVPERDMLQEVKAVVFLP
ncbi:hypothetical protein [Geobacillus subterraneus]|uniref:Uncharacterized protein n=1 Tax=Geobacillus subterraneus TaxID=129338 RepID=A0A679G1G1_9BACL|nr:hypothetical protein [Geobacillus subterraneus]BBW98934.1 hypothetical protein GsuE55_37670 [Geobacillus subterraneus]